MRQLAAWEGVDGRFYLSAFLADKTHANSKTPAKAFASKEELEAYARTRTDAKRRAPEVVWEHLAADLEPADA